MSDFEIASIIISSFAAIGTIISSIVALTLAKTPKPLSFKTIINNEKTQKVLGYEFAIVNKSAVEQTVNAITISVNGDEYPIEWNNRDELISFPYKLSPGENLIIDDIKKNIYKVVYYKNKNAQIFINIYDSFGRSKKIQYGIISDFKQWGAKHNVILPYYYSKVSKQLNSDEIAIVFYAREEKTFLSPSNETISYKTTVMKAVAIKSAYYGQIVSDPVFHRIYAQSDLNEFVFVFNDNTNEIYAADYNDAINIISKYILREIKLS